MILKRRGSKLHRGRQLHTSLMYQSNNVIGWDKPMGSGSSYSVLVHSIAAISPVFFQALRRVILKSTVYIHLDLLSKLGSFLEADLQLINPTKF